MTSELLIGATANPNLVLLIDALRGNGLWVFILLLVIIPVFFGMVKEIVKVRARERSRREIAAYIAEGSMTPEQGERLMRAGASSSEC